MVKHLDITITGRVQAVGFRYHTKQTAERLGIRGTVQNQTDATVRIEAEGEEEQLQKFLNWCQEGPDAADVDNLEHNISEIKGYNRFEII